MADHVFLVVVHMYDTSDDEYYVCPNRKQALIFASNLVIKDMMEGARCTKAEMRRLKKPLQRLAAWADHGSYVGRLDTADNLEFSSGSIGSVRITKAKVHRNDKLKWA